MFALDGFLTPCTGVERANDGDIIDSILVEREREDQPVGDDACPGAAGLVYSLGSNAVDSERCAGPGAGGRNDRGQLRHQLEALATLPVELVATLPADHIPGSRIRMCGPHGRMEVDSPAAAQPGEKIKYLLGPTPEYSVEVPPGASPSTRVRFRRADGVEVCVPIPPSKRPGQRFEVTPPALMVQVPEGALPGDFVVFRHSLGSSGKGVATEETEWCRARVPEGLRPGNYFAARLPQPEAPSSKSRKVPSLFELAMAVL